MQQALAASCRSPLLICMPRCSPAFPAPGAGTLHRWTSGAWSVDLGIGPVFCNDASAGIPGAQRGHLEHLARIWLFPLLLHVAHAGRRHRLFRPRPAPSRSCFLLRPPFRRTSWTALPPLPPSWTALPPSWTAPPPSARAKVPQSWALPPSKDLQITDHGTACSGTPDSKHPVGFSEPQPYQSCLLCAASACGPFLPMQPRRISPVLHVPSSLAVSTYIHVRPSVGSGRQGPWAHAAGPHPTGPRGTCLRTASAQSPGGCPQVHRRARPLACRGGEVGRGRRLRQGGRAGGSSLGGLWRGLFGEATGLPAGSPGTAARGGPARG